ncbi:MAG TPA: T9SS type A sorting domain-containing protein, partial [Bacteroidetes bacterium]|nr:T9SS type A sorting domain-containing protein [Bacteroidota bacterium]
TSKIVGGIPYQLLPLKPVDESKGIYEVDTSAIPDVVKNQPPLWGMLTSADGDTLEPLFATVDADSDSVAEVLELDADHDGRFDTFLFAVGGDSCGYNLAKVDTNADGEVDLIFSDLTGDGFFDAVDLNLDGRNDAFDTNGDGVFDRVDYDCDGTFDAYDVNLNGRLDLFLIPAGGFTKVQETRAQNLPRRFTMTQNYPNPVSWSQATTLRYGLPRGAHVRIELYNVLGQKVATVIDRRETPGWHEIAWSPRSALRPLPSGVYFLRFTADAGRTFQAVRKMVIRR